MWCRSPSPPTSSTTSERAVVREIRWEADCIVGETKRAEKAGGLEQCFADVRSDARLMSYDVQLFDQLEDVVARNGAVELYVEVPEALDSLAHVFEAAARQVVGPRLQEALGVGPLDEKEAALIREQVERLSWAVDRAAEYHAKAAEARKLAGGRS